VKVLSLALAAFVASCLGAVWLAPVGAGESGDRGGPGGNGGGRPPPTLANGCFALASSADDRFVAIRGAGYRADARREGAAAAFHLKPTGLGTYLLQDQERMLLAAGAEDTAGRDAQPGEPSEWRIRGRPSRGFSLVSTPDGRRLAVDPSDGTLILAETSGARFDLVLTEGCKRFPEAKVGASGRPTRGTNPDGTLPGFADTHLHVTANLRAGGQVISGESFHRFGIGEALGRDERNHGPDGSLDVVGNLLRGGQEAGTHDTHGWPTFVGWPVHDTYTHQQAYYVWLKRAWMAGLRFVVAQAVEDEALCEIVPMRSHSCDETETVKLAIAQLHALQDYIDAQSGGRGKGWFRIVRNPRQARRVIERGKLAVIIGMETSSPLGCSEFQNEPQCTREDIDRVLGELYDLGVRSIFVAHWIDNAFGGVALQSGAQGEIIALFQAATTGHPFMTKPCGEADEADGQCNVKGLTDLGQYFLERMMDRNMLIEADHLSQEARQGALAIAEAQDYPLVSSHTGTGGEWIPAQLERLYAVGGVASATPEIAPEMVAKIRELRAGAGRRGAAVALGSDTGGFAALPGRREDDGPKLRYPFDSYDGEVRFKRQRSGQRTYDLNTDGIAHYGLFADLIADMQRQPGGERALRSLFGSAEAYVRMWERTYERR
jgi:microsomal dipeptidase-like Zn-dependent dipeptidase